MGRCTIGSSFMIDAGDAGGRRGGREMGDGEDGGGRGGCDMTFAYM